MYSDLGALLKAVIYKPRYCADCEMEGRPHQEMKRVFALSRDDIIAIQSRPPSGEIAKILEQCELREVSHCPSHIGSSLYCSGKKNEGVAETHGGSPRRLREFVNMTPQVDIDFLRKVAQANLPKY